ncbi:CAP domain-containing protein [Desulfosporosinus sp. SB140]|uniref:CAP domain-containing protein n=1 Tax=Desulfosporosinus paludis TaxID=3115649 RepID=UPI003890BBD8
MKRLILFLSIIIVTIVILVSFPFQSLAQTQFSRTNVPAQLKITASAVNVRSGPSTTFLKVGAVYKGQVLECLGKLGSWWVVHLTNDTVGAISGGLAQPYYPTTTQQTAKPAPAPSEVTLTTGQQHMLDLINQERSKAGVGTLKIDPQLQKMAQTKSDEMVAKNYFSHTSPTYGDPFNMMKTFGINYTSAGENIAGDSSVDAAHQALMNDPPHKANILNASFNYIGIGITSSPTYGYVFVQDFIGR